jgi:hypothetical protein
MTKKELIEKISNFIQEIDKLKDLSHQDPIFKDYRIRVQKFLEELAIMEISRELIHYKSINFFHAVMRSVFSPPGPSPEDISQYKKGLNDLGLLLIRVKDDVVNFNSNSRSYSNNLGFKPKR